MFEEDQKKLQNNIEVHSNPSEDSIITTDEEKNSRNHVSKYDINNITSIKSYSDQQIWHLLKILKYDDVHNLDDLPPEVEFLGTRLHEITAEEALEVVSDAVEYHNDDPNIPVEQYNEYIRYKESGVDTNNEVDVFTLKALAVLLRDHSPYPEVRAVCPPPMLDDPDVPVETFRAYFFALIWVVFSSGFNELFSHRLVSISITTSVIQMFLYPMGKFWEKWVPSWGFNFRGKKYALNVDYPWSAKEQMFCTLIISISMVGFYSGHGILTQKIYYGQKVSFGYQFWFSFGVEFLGFGFAGILRKFVIYPSKAVWPTSLSTIALNRTLLTPEDPNAKGISRYNLFFLGVLFMFIYTWFPTFLFEALSTFNWMTWIAPNNWNLAAITGTVSGLGINPIASFDWNIITSTSMLTPWFSVSTQYAGSFLSILIMIAVYFKNSQYTKYLPIFSNDLFTNRAEKFDVLEILDSDYKFDNEKYQKYSPPFYSAGNVVCYGAYIAVYPFWITYYLITDYKLFYTAFKLWGTSLWSLRKKSTWVSLYRDDAHALDEFKDPHSRAMARYREVPDWWFFVILLVAVISGICTLEAYSTNTPVWSLFMALGFSLVFLIPMSILQATAGVSFGLNLLIEMIMGYALPGNPIALMIIKCYGYNIDKQADSYVSNLKLAHYCKIPPRALFKGQLLINFIRLFVNLGVINWAIDNFKGFCHSNQKAKFTCPDAQIFYNSSVMWGGMGPKKIFNDVYPILKWCWLIGFLLGVFLAILKRYSGRYFPTWFNPVLFVIGMVVGPPYSLWYYTPPLIMCFFSQWYAKRYHLKLWERYNYVLAAALNAGLVLASIVIFFAVQYKSKTLSWWGNNVINAGQDYKGTSLLNVTNTAKGYFGPAPGHYP